MSNITLNTEVKDADTVAQWAKIIYEMGFGDQFVDVDKEQKIKSRKKKSQKKKLRKF